MPNALIVGIVNSVSSLPTLLGFADPGLARRRWSSAWRDAGAVWICIALVVHVVLGTLWRPLLEMVYDRNGAVALGMEIVRQLVEAGIGITIAWGMTLSSRALPARPIAT